MFKALWYPGPGLLSLDWPPLPAPTHAPTPTPPTPIHQFVHYNVPTNN